MLLRAPRDQQILRCGICALETSRSRVNILLTKRASRKPSNHRCSVISFRPRQSGLRQFCRTVREPVATVPADLVWEPTDRDTLLKDSSRSRFTKASSLKICSFLADAELILTLCKGRKIAKVSLFSIGSAAKKPRKSEDTPSLTLLLITVPLAKAWCRFLDDLNSKVLIARHSGTLKFSTESIDVDAARTTDLCSRAYPNFSTEDQLSPAVDHFIVADVSSREYKQRTRAFRTLEWQEAI